jgi:hypothetical protein
MNRVAIVVFATLMPAVSGDVQEEERREDSRQV